MSGEARQPLGDSAAGHAAAGTAAADRARLQAKADEIAALLAEPPAVDPRLVELTPQEEHALRDRLEEFSADREKDRHVVAEARRVAAASAAAYEALMDIDLDALSQRRRLFDRNRNAQIAVSVFLPIAFMVAGILMFVHGRQINSLSFTAFGCALVVMAFFLAAAAIVVLFRPDKTIEALEQRRRDAEWVMLQDGKRLDAALANSDALADELRAFLEDNALADANGSARQALMLLDDAASERARIAKLRQRQAAINLRMSRRTVL